jgi:hypothetical protein
MRLQTRDVILGRYESAFVVNAIGCRFLACLSCELRTFATAHPAWVHAPLARNKNTKYDSKAEREGATASKIVSSCKDDGNTPEEQWEAAAGAGSQPISFRGPRMSMCCTDRLPSARPSKCPR